MTGSSDSPRSVAVSLALTPLTLGTAYGFYDLYQGGQSLEPRDAAFVLSVWMAVGALVSLTAFAVLWPALQIGRRFGDPTRLGAFAVWFVMQGLVVWALRRDFLALKFATILLSLLGVFLARNLWRPARARTRFVLHVLTILGLGAATWLLADRRMAEREAPAPLAAGQANDAKRPHIVVLLLDTQRADYLGPYGDRGLTPVLDEWAEDAVVFERAYSQAPWTVPSHASLFTGLYPVTHGCSGDVHRWLDDEFTTLAEDLRDSGYRTAAVSANIWVKKANLHQGFDSYAQAGKRFRTLLLRDLLQILGLPARWADQGGADAVDQVAALLQNAEPSTAPLFLFVNITEPHWKHLPVIERRGDYLPNDLSVVEATRILNDYSGHLTMAGGRASPRLNEALRAMYASAVAYQDELFGRFLEVVGEHLGWENTLLCITADHGENLGEAGRYAHCFSVSDYLLHVPLMLRLPAEFDGGRREPGMCQMIDLHVTLRELADLEVPAELPGRSLLPAAFEPRTHVHAQGDPFANHLGGMSMLTGMRRDVAEFAASQRVIRGERFKLVTKRGWPSRLYDMQADPDEAVNVMGEHPQVAEDLAQRLAAWWEGLPVYVPREEQGGDTMDEADLATLKALGYIR